MRERAAELDKEHVLEEMGTCVTSGEEYQL